MSYVSYERLLVLLDGSGIDVGTINHSRKFVASLLPSFLHVFRSRLKRFFAEPVASIGDRLRPFALMADKLTVKRVTQEAVGLIYLDEQVGELKALFVSCEPVPPSGSTALALARSHIKVLSDSLGVEDELVQRLVGCAYDGAYIMGGIRKHLLKEMEAKGGEDNQFFSCMWDVAHQFERGFGDVFDDKKGGGGNTFLQSVDWLMRIPDQISAVNNQFAYGKGNAEARELAIELAEVFRDPYKLIETRFAATKLRAITSFLQSFKVMAEWYRRAGSIPAEATSGSGKNKKPRTTRLVEEASYHATYCSMRDGAFVGRLLMLRDVLTFGMELSLMAQTVNVLPWELREMQLQLTDRLGRMASDLYRAEKDKRPPVLREDDWPLLFSPASPSFPDGPTVWDEVTTGSFDGIELEMPWGFDDRTIEGSEEYTLEQLPDLFKDEAADLVRALHHFLELRFVKCKCPPRQGEKSGPSMAVISGHKESYGLIEAAGRCFDLRRLCMSSEPGGEAAALEEILAAADEGGVVFDVRSGREPLLAQLETLRVRLSTAAKIYPYSERWFVTKEGTDEKSVVSGTIIMKDLFTVSELRRDLEDILYVFNHLILKIVNEAVVEGMGSIVSMHGDKLRGRLRQS